MREFIQNRYFTGSQCQILLGTKVLAEAVAVEGVLNIVKVPFYGYKSQFFDTVATGRVLATGSITINYVYSGYLLGKILANSKDITEEEKVAQEKETPADAFDASPATDLYREMYPLDDERIIQQQAQWDDANLNNPDIQLTPEFLTPVNLKIRDFRIGFARPKTNDPEEDQYTYEQKELIEVYFQNYSTIRRTDGSPTMETYSFIAKTLI